MTTTEAITYNLENADANIVELNLDASNIKVDKWGVRYFENQGVLWFRQSDIFPYGTDGSVSRNVKGYRGFRKYVSGPILLKLAAMQSYIRKNQTVCSMRENILNRTRLYAGGSVYVSWQTVYNIITDIISRRAPQWGIAECAFVWHYFKIDAGVSKAKQNHFTRKRIKLNNKREQAYKDEVAKVEELKTNTVKLKVASDVFEKALKQVEKHAELCSNLKYTICGNLANV